MSFRQFNDKKLVLASHNKGKLLEIKELLAPYNVDVISAGELDLPEPEETGLTFIENAKIKALAASKATGLPALADDSGLSVDALNGAPGIYSARWAGENKDFDMAMEKVNSKLEETKDKERKAHFACALCLAWADEHVETFEGRVYGNLVWPPRGKNGFGFDPMFSPEGYEGTFGEIESEIKQKISHRVNAFNLLIENCFKHK